jgi:hypothetical protein
MEIMADDSVKKVNNLSISNVPEKEEWKPPTEPVTDSGWKPPTDPLVSKAAPEEQPNILSRAWAAANEPLIKVSPEMRQALDAFTQEHPIMGGVGELGLGAMTGMSSPMALGLGALTGGAGLAEKLGSEGLATALHTPGRIAAGGMVGHGLYNVFNEPDLGGKIGGGIEAGMGAIGLRNPMKPSVDIIPPERRLGTGRVMTGPQTIGERKLLGTGRVIDLPSSTSNAPSPEHVAVGDEPPYEGPKFKNTEQLRYDLARNKLKMGIDVPELPKGIKPEGEFVKTISQEKASPIYRATDFSKPEKVKVPVSKIVATQGGFQEPILKKYGESSGSELPSASKVGDEYILNDGHHRVLAQIRNGAKEIELNSHPVDEAKISNPEPRKYAFDSFKEFAKSQEGAIRRPDPYKREARPEVINKLVDALKEAGPKRATQEEMYSEERSARITAAQQVKGSGLKKFYGQLHELKGELPKVDFTSIKVEPSDLNDMLNTVDKSNYLLPFEKIRAKMGLLKMLTKSRAEVPTTSELRLLGQVFGKDFDEVIEMHGGFGGSVAKQILQDAANAPKAIMASVDMSAPLRQGLPLIHKKEWWNSIKPMVEAFVNEKNYEATMQAIKDRPKYLLGKEAGLKLTGVESDLGTREEAYGSNIANLVPGVKRSERAYVAFLNKLRADTFDSLIEDAQRQGLHPKDVMHEVANFVNVATGRGSLGNLDKVATELNTVFFSPRLIASRLTMLNPNYYVKASPFVRKEALKSLLAVASAGLTVNGLMSAMGAKTDTTLSDKKGSPLLPISGAHGMSGMPINADFGKSKFGNTRLENYGGFLPYITYAGRMLSGERESSTTGKISQLGKGFNTASRLSTTEDFVANKLSPVASLMYKILKQKDPTGKEYQLSPDMKQSLIDISNGNINAAVKNAKAGEVGSMFIPMFLGDLIDIYKDDPKHLPLVAGSFFGMGTQTYQPTMRKSNQLRIRP